MCIWFNGIPGSEAFNNHPRKLGWKLTAITVGQCMEDGRVAVFNNRRAVIVSEPGVDTEPSFSPDSKYLVFTSEKGGKPQIYRYDLAAKRSERLTFEGDQNFRARYSTDGKYLVFVHLNEGRFHIASMDMASRDIRVLTETDLDESPSIAPNGTMLVYATQRGGQGVLAWVSLDGQVTNQMKSDFGDVLEPAWSPYLN